MVRIEDIEEQKDFAMKAASYFAKNEKFEGNDITTFTVGNIEAGCYFAVRWGLMEDCVLIFKLAEDFEPTIYQQVIKRDP